MANFKLHNLSAWWRLDETVAIPGVAGVPQRLRLRLNVRGDVAVYASDEDGRTILLCSGPGMHRVDATLIGAGQVMPSGKGEVYVRANLEPQILPSADTPSFTTLEPKGSGIHSEVHRMMLLQRLNADAREMALRKELAELGEGYRDLRARLAQRMKPVVAEPEPATSEAPVAE